MDFPVIQLGHRGRYVRLVRTEKELTTCSSGAFKTDFFKPPHIILDASLTRFDVGAVEKRGPAGPLWGLSFKYGRRYRISYAITSSSRITLEDLKDLVGKAAHGYMNSWESGAVSGGQVLARLHGAGSFSDVVRVLDEFGGEA